MNQFSAKRFGTPMVLISLVALLSGLTPVLASTADAASKRTAFCKAEAYLALHAENGSLAPGYTTVTEEKKELETIDTDISIAVKDAPSVSFGMLTKPLKGTFIPWIDSPTLLKDNLKGVNHSPPERLVASLMAKTQRYGYVTLSHDFMNPVLAECPSLKSSRSGIVPTPAFLTTPAAVHAYEVGVGASEASYFAVEQAKLRKYDDTNFILGARAESKKDPTVPVSVIGVPQLAKGKWIINYRVKVKSAIYRVSVSMPDLPTTSLPHLSVTDVTLIS